MNDRMPPHSPDAERALLGACLISQQAVDDVEDLVRAEDFYHHVHAKVFLAVLAVRDSGVQPDPISVAAELDRRGQLGKVGGAPYLLTLMQSVPVASNAAFYAEKVADAAVLRRLLEVAQRAEQVAQSPADSASDAVEAVRADLDRIAVQARAGVNASAIGDLAAAALARYDTPIVEGLETPWVDLNANLAGGLRAGTLTVIGARPGAGKSIAGANLCLHAAQQGVGALLVSLEMPAEEVADRIVSALSRVTYYNILTHDLDSYNRQRVETAIDKLAGMPLRIVDDSYLSLAAIRSLARSELRSDTGLGLLVVDYLQLMAPADARTPRQEQIAAMSRGLKLLAKELDIAVVALAQLNRAGAHRSDKRPTLTDLRESGSIEQDADHVILLHHPEEEARMGELDFVLAKNRKGSTGNITVVWAPHHQAIRCLARGES